MSTRQLQKLDIKGHIWGNKRTGYTVP